MPLLRDSDGSFSKSTKQNLDILRRSHFAESKVNFNIDKGMGTLSSPKRDEDLERFINMDLLEKAITGLPTGKAPGPDKIKNEVLKQLNTEYKRELLNLCKYSIYLSFIPAAWLDITAIFIRKQGKPDATNPKTYRPIGLSSSLLKLCERLLNWWLKSTVLKDGIPRQHAFTAGLSTETAISEITNLIEKAKHNKQHAMLLSVDIQGAFDNIPFSVIKEALITHGAHPPYSRMAGLPIQKQEDYYYRQRSDNNI